MPPTSDKLPVWVQMRLRSSGRITSGAITSPPSLKQRHQRTGMALARWRAGGAAHLNTMSSLSISVHVAWESRLRVEDGGVRDLGDLRVFSGYIRCEI